MLTLAWYFWLVIWATIGGGALVTVALCLAIAVMPRPHLHHTAAARPHHGFRPLRHAHA
jgi:hypothetical protein